MISNPYSRQYYTNLSGRDLQKDRVTNGFTYNTRAKPPATRLNSFIHSYSSDTDESVYKDDLDYNNCPSVHSQSSINCTPVPVHMSKGSPEDTPQALYNSFDNSKKRRLARASVEGAEDSSVDDLSVAHTPKSNRYLKSEHRRGGLLKMQNEVSTPDVTKRESKGLKSGYSDQNLDSTLTSYVDSLFGVEPYKYVHEHQPLKLFWLHNSEVSGLMMVPSLSCLSTESSNSEKLYMVFTDYSIDILQDVSSLKMITPREGYTPFVVIYSYNLKSMYFKVVKRTVDDVDMVSFNKCSTDLNDCLSFDTLTCNSFSSEDDSNYVFYRSYLYGKDDDSDPNRVRVFVHPANKTSFDLRYLSITSQNSNRELMIKSFSRNLNSGELKDSFKRVEFNGHNFDELEDQNEVDEEESSMSDSPFSHTYQTCAGMNLPDDLFDECKLLVGVDSTGKNSGHPDSIANYRSESVIKKNFTVYPLESLSTPLSKEVLSNLVKVRDEPGFAPETKEAVSDDTMVYESSDPQAASSGNEVDGEKDPAESGSTADTLNVAETATNSRKSSSFARTRKVLYRSGNVEFYEGQQLKFEFPTIYTKHFEYDYVTLYSDDTLRSCFNFIKSLQPEDLLSININKLAQFCPNIFWNLALAGDIETAIIELDPEVIKSLYRRKRTVQPDQDAFSNKTNSTNSLSYLDNNFIIMQNLFKRDADEKIKKLLQAESRNSSVGRMSRVVINKNVEEEDLIRKLLDENGFLRKSMSVLTEKQKNTVYNECMRRNFYVPVHIKFNPQKGRGVYAAYKIHKEDFLMEYKGELITEKVARFRNNKYNKSKRYKGSFIFFFKHNGTKYGIDATEEDISFGPARLVNHSRKRANVIPKTMLSNNYPRLIFIAKRDIECGEELLVDYGERDPSVIRDNPWLLD